jgi:hypothetical protein
VAVLAAGTVLRLWLALGDDGVYWPDEIMQSLEQAHRLVFGYGLVPWEFVQGVRSWTFPGLLGGLIQAGAVVGLDEPRQYLTLVRLALVAVAAATGVGVWWLARAHGASPLAAAAGVSLFALGAPMIYFAPRALTETVSAAPVVAGLALALRPAAGHRSVVAGSALLGLATALRLHNGIFCVALLAVLLARGRRGAAARAVAALATLAAAYALLDWATWGGPLHSVAGYVRFNVVEGRASDWGTHPLHYYAETLHSSMGPAAVVLGGLAALAVVRAPGLVLAAAAYLLGHSLVPHKELRFVVPVLPVLAALAGVGLQVVLDRLPRPGAPALRTAVVAAVLAAATLSAARLPGLTVADVGLDPRSTASALDHLGPLNRLLLAAGGRADLCGLLVRGVDVSWTGGYTYLHRRVPLYDEFETRPPGDESANYVVAPDEGRALQAVARDGDWALARLHDGPCAPDAGYTFRIPSAFTG